MTKWIAFAEKFPENSEAHLSAYNELNGCLASKSVLVGEGLTPSEADIIVFSAIYSYVVCIIHISVLINVCYGLRVSHGLLVISDIK